jgi:hypothetical protein
MFETKTPNLSAARPKKAESGPLGASVAETPEQADQAHAERQVVPSNDKSCSTLTTMPGEKRAVHRDSVFEPSVNNPWLLPSSPSREALDQSI